MTLSHSDPNPDGLPLGLVRPVPTITDQQPCLFRVSLPDALAKLGVSPDDLNRWHGQGWLSFDATMDEELDEFSDPKLWEIQVVRDIVRSGLTDAQIGVLFSKLPKPFAFNPDALVYSFRHGWVLVPPRVEIPEPSEVIEEHLDDWIADRDQGTLESLRDKISEALEQLEKEE